MRTVHEWSLAAPDVSLDTLRLVFGAEPCESCQAHVTTAEVVDDDGALTGDRALTEIETRAWFGVAHTAERCRELRGQPS